MYQLISQTNGSSSTKYVELENKGHWFEGALTTPPLLQFYEKTLRQSCVPPIPLHFTMLIPDPAGIGSRAGLKIDALKTPDQIGKMIVERNPAFSSWTLTTRNISQFHLMVGSPPRHNDFRYGLQSGPLNSILRSPGHFTIRSASPGCSAVSLQVARNLHQYFAADVEFLLEANRPTTSSGNLIQIAIGQDDLESGEQANPVTIGDSYLILKRANGCESTIARESGIGAVYLRPATNKRLELVVWGSDEAGLRQAARLLPLLTGVGLPELIIVSKRCASQGSAGVVAMGSLTKSWRLSESSYVS
ncbi:uncharacterized protein KY384_000223 [Bacidia gigantensis]|uniref:uncharacterized protein n=1 Tax=Bacidia gigantensis TaxID=2732470 RepID=UPI001D044AE4|nr:uncharacterized protein KY384_000223 [Bacidia gigantensis]KAG8526230.1 hypothetical protein KY384_000223 [Bacidia gigantensis]